MISYLCTLPHHLPTIPFQTKAILIQTPDKCRVTHSRGTHEWRFFPVVALELGVEVWCILEERCCGSGVVLHCGEVEGRLVVAAAVVRVRPLR